MSKKKTHSPTKFSTVLPKAYFYLQVTKSVPTGKSEVNMKRGEERRAEKYKYFNSLEVKLAFFLLELLPTN